jgi:hypothetical protein
MSDNPRKIWTIGVGGARAGREKSPGKVKRICDESVDGAVVLAFNFRNGIGIQQLETKNAITLDGIRRCAPCRCGGCKIASHRDEGRILRPFQGVATPAASRSTPASLPTHAEKTGGLAHPQCRILGQAD